MLELRLYNTKKSIEQELERDDMAQPSETLSPNLLQPQMERLKRENEMLKRQLKLEKENASVLNQNEKSFFELKLKEKDNEALELERQTAMHKRKYQKICEEMQDVQRMCEESKTRNRELEKLQHKFDSDMSVWRNKYENERETREKCERERDTTKYEVFSLKSELDSLKLEAAYHVEKNERLEKDLKEYENVTSSTSSLNNFSMGNSGGSSDQFVKLKAQIRDLESRLRDQEEELDEQTGSIQQLEQTKLRLEMQFEKEKQKWQREIAEKESEMDDLRFHTQKKIKNIEMQLEEESELASGLQREKRDLERKIREMTASVGSKRGNYGGSSADVHLNGAYAEYVSKLKRQMLKYKTLAIDAQTQLEKLKENIPKQSIMKALKAQLEDSEISKANALKTKQLLQAEINDLQQELDDAHLHKQNVWVFFFSFFRLFRLIY
jgi:myosin-18